MRQANNLPRATRGEVEFDIDEAQCERLGFDAKFCIKKNSSTGFTFTPMRLFQASATHLREGVKLVARRSAELASGVDILTDWLGAGGKPVEQSLSQSRADVCLQCSFNQPGFKPVEAVAKAIAQQIEKKNELNLSVVGEENLHTCDVCWCHLPLKVHVPLIHITDNTPIAMIEKFQQSKPDCWLVTEINQTPAIV